MLRSPLVHQMALCAGLALTPALASAQEDAPPEAAASPDAAPSEVEAPPAKATLPAAKAESAQAKAEPAQVKAGQGLLGPLRIGPTLQLGFPHPLTYGLDALYDGTFGFGFSTGKFTTPEIKSTKIDIASWDLRFRWHPWQGSFFLGAAYGQQEILGKAKKDIKFESQGIEMTVPTTAQIDIKTTYLTPHLGWFAVWDSGFTLGFELGLQMPLSSKTEFETGFDNVSPSQEKAVKDSDKYKDLDKQVNDAGKLFGKTAIPYLTLLRLGWLL